MSDSPSDADKVSLCFLSSVDAGCSVVRTRTSLNPVSFIYPDPQQAPREAWKPNCSLPRRGSCRSIHPQLVYDTEPDSSDPSIVTIADRRDQHAQLVCPITQAPTAATAATVRRETDKDHRSSAAVAGCPVTKHHPRFKYPSSPTQSRREHRGL